MTLALAVWLIAGIGAQPQPSGTVEGIVVDAFGARLSGVIVALSTDVDSPTTSTDADGSFQFEGVPPGLYTLVASLAGFEEVRLDDVAVAAGARSSRRLVLTLSVAEDVTVAADPLAASDAARSGETQVSGPTLTQLPLPTGNFEDALPLVPGVVRGPDGRLNLGGTRASQSALLLNGLNVTDPVTGQFAVGLPLEAVAALDVYTGVYSARFGSATGGIANIVTRPGEDAWSTEVEDFMRRVRFRDGKIRGIRSFAPRVRVAGPIKTGSLWFSQSINYAFERDRVEDLEAFEPLPRTEQVREMFNGLTQIDYAATPTHRMTFTLAWFPGNVDNVQIDTLHPFEAAPDSEQRGWSGAVSDHLVLGPRTTMNTSAAVKAYDLRVLPKTADASRVTVDGVRQNYFNRLSRDSRRYDLATTLTAERDGPSGSHLLMAGGELTHAWYRGEDASLPVVVSRADGTLTRRIDFHGDPTVRASNTQVSVFAEDRWSPAGRLTLNLGARYAFEQIAGEHTLAPRLEASLRPFDGDHTVIRGGYGRFYDRLPLIAGDFESRQSRRETTFGPQGDAAEPISILEFANRIAAGGLRTPLSNLWHLELHQALGDDTQVRVGYRARRGSRELVVDPIAGAGEMLLSNDGTSRSHEVELTVQRRLREEGELNMSYVWARAQGNLNDFVTIFGDQRDPIVHSDVFSRQPFDAPHRVVVWGVMNLPKQITIAPTLEFRTGFPYTVVDEAQRAVGVRNEGPRFPNLFSLDLLATKVVKLTDRMSARVGVQIYNLGSHFNPRDVSNNTGSARFGAFANSVTQGVGMRFALVF
ncbi:MAG: TonB-dependent receptor [Vicinamibacterales bacterium]|nr:hypothetical protein [Acidobacteriota bacterium]MDP6370906.1 TonB-dependent receptor [Vicinamibacterales bacterium]MDP6608378.1 TonB-dependent receptor [Vicinamibacterales bacterium]